MRMRVVDGWSQPRVNVVLVSRVSGGAVSSGSAYEREAMASAVVLKPVGLDDYSAVRYVHSTSLRLQGMAYLTEDEIQAFTDFVYSTEYVASLMQDNLVAAWLGDELVGTAGWCPSDSNGSAARIRSVHVRPLFTGLDIGTRLVLDAEDRARRAGFSEFSTRATPNAVGFFNALGYEVTSYGVRQLANEHGLPVSFMRKQSPPQLEPVEPSGKVQLIVRHPEPLQI